MQRDCRRNRAALKIDRHARSDSSYQWHTEYEAIYQLLVNRGYHITPEKIRRNIFGRNGTVSIVRVQVEVYKREHNEFQKKIET